MHTSLGTLWKQLSYTLEEAAVYGGDFAMVGAAAGLDRDDKSKRQGWNQLFQNYFFKMKHQYNTADRKGSDQFRIGKMDCPLASEFPF